MPQHQHHSARRAGGEHLDEESALQAEIGNLHSRSGGEKRCRLEGYNYRLVDISDAGSGSAARAGINSVFSQLSAQESCGFQSLI